MFTPLQYFQKKRLTQCTCDRSEEETIGVLNSDFLKGKLKYSFLANCKCSYYKRCFKHCDVFLLTSALILQLQILNRKTLFSYYKVKLHQVLASKKKRSLASCWNVNISKPLGLNIVSFMITYCR